MTMIPHIPAGIGSGIGDFDLSDCFFHAGQTLYRQHMMALQKIITKSAHLEMNFI